MVNEKTDLDFLKSAQQGMRDWNLLLEERSTRQDKPIKPQMVAAMLSEELEDDAIISVDSGTNTIWAAPIYSNQKGNEVLSFRNTGIHGMWSSVCNCSASSIS